MFSKSRKIIHNGCHQRFPGSNYGTEGQGYEHGEEEEVEQLWWIHDVYSSWIHLRKNVPDRSLIQR